MGHAVLEPLYRQIAAHRRRIGRLFGLPVACPLPPRKGETSSTLIGVRQGRPRAMRQCPSPARVRAFDEDLDHRHATRERQVPLGGRSDLVERRGRGLDERQVGDDDVERALVRLVVGEARGDGVGQAR